MHPKQYGKPEYWEERYAADSDPFDWYQRWAGLRDVFLEYMKPEFKILVVGCGSSRISEEMYDEGFQDITNIDFSNIVIKSMQERYADRPSMKFITMNVLDMSAFEEKSFDLVIDKGTLDSIVCADGSIANGQTMLKEISHVLKPGGTFICVSHSSPSYRMSYLQRSDLPWQVKVNAVTKPMISTSAAMAAGFDEKQGHYIYICSKAE